MTSRAVCLVLGFPLAYSLARTQSRFKNLLIIADGPAAVRRQCRARRRLDDAVRQQGLRQRDADVARLIDKPIKIMYTEFAVIIGIIAVNLPFMVLTLQSVIEGIDRAIEEAAFSLGAPPFTMFRRVLWPLALPGILAGTILTFILAMNAYATPVLLGGPHSR